MNTAENNLKETSMEFLCLICKQKLQLPVDITASAFNCNCSYHICLFCALDWFKFNILEEKLSNDIKCLICRKSSRSYDEFSNKEDINKYFKISIEMCKALDLLNLHDNICRFCSSDCISYSSLIRHLISECKYKDNYIETCPYCDKHTYIKKYGKTHFISCEKAPYCPICSSDYDINEKDFHIYHCATITAYKLYSEKDFTVNQECLLFILSILNKNGPKDLYMKLRNKFKDIIPPETIGNIAGDDQQLMGIFNQMYHLGLDLTHQH